MNELHKSFIDNSTSFLMHYNHNHDKLGRFATASGAVGVYKSITKNAMKHNLDKWGNSKNTNVLYVTGKSGSGKSTVAKKIADKKTRVINLDSYFDNSNDGPRDEEFDKYLDKHLPNYRMLGAPKDQISLNDWGKLCAKFEIEIENYGQYQHSKGKKVIAEGVELLDDTIRPDKSFFKDKPVVMLKTNSVKSITRAAKRDDVKLTPGEIKRYAKDSIAWQKDINKFNKRIHHNYDKLGRFARSNGSGGSMGPYKSELITEQSLNKYKDQARQLSHVRVNNNTKGQIFTDNQGKLVGMVNTEKKDDGNTWIQGVEVFGDNKGKGLSYKLLDKATENMGATHLSVNKNNQVAKHVYDNYGFETYKSDESMYYMRLKKRKK